MNTGRDSSNSRADSIAVDIKRKLAEIAAIPGQVSDIVPNRIRQQLQDPNEANAILSDTDYALRRLRTGTPNQQFAALLSLTFVLRDESTLFRELVATIAGNDEPTDLRCLAVITCGNLYAGTRDTKMLAVLETVSRSGRFAKYEADAVKSAGARIRGECPTDSVSRHARAILERLDVSKRNLESQKDDLLLGGE